MKNIIFNQVSKYVDFSSTNEQDMFDIEFKRLCNDFTALSEKNLTSAIRDLTSNFIKLESLTVHRY